MLTNKLMSAVATAALIATGAAMAEPVTLTFEGVGNGNAVGNYYNGGAGGSLGVQFSSNTLALVDSDVVGPLGGNFANEPTPDTIMFFVSGGSSILTYSAGFTVGFSFWYTSRSEPGLVEVFASDDASGQAMATISLSALGGCPDNGHGGDPTGGFCRWAIGSTTITGTARSIRFTGVDDQIGFDNITFGSTNPNLPTPAPEPGSLALVGAALLGLAAARRRV